MIPASLEEIDRLGEPLAERHARTFVLLFELLIGVFLFLFGFAPALFCAVAIHIILGFLILCFTGVFVYFGARITLRAWRGLGVRLLVFPDGIVYKRRRKVVAYRWQDILAFSYWAEDRVNLGTYIESLFRYRFRHRDGHHFRFEECLNRNRKKPLAQFVEEGLAECQLPALREKFLQQHEEIRFGPFTLGLEGLGYKRALLPWPEVDFIWAEDGRVRVRKKDKVFNWCSVKMVQVPNCCLLLALAKERHEREESRT